MNSFLWRLFFGQFKPEEDLMGCILRVREVANAAYWWWMFWLSVSYAAAFALPLVAVYLADHDSIDLVGVKTYLYIEAGVIFFIGMLDPRARVARAEVAFNILAWFTRIEAVALKDDPQMVRRAVRRLYRAIQYTGTKDAAAILSHFPEGGAAEGEE